MTKQRSPQVLDLTSVEIDDQLAPFDDGFDDQPPQTPSKWKWRWLSLFGSAMAGLIVLGLTLWAENLVTTLLERQPALGWVALALVVTAGFALIGLAAKEIGALSRLNKLDGLRDKVQTAYTDKNTKDARSALADIVSLYKNQPRTAQGRAAFERQSVGVLDAQDLITIGEDTLMTAIDEEAVRRVSTAARRVSLVTALSPRALIDVTMVAFQCLSLTRQVAELYGARPGFLGALKLGRLMIAHLAITGGIAATEGLVSQVLGHSLAARLSTRLGEGVINGLLTARVGIAAIAVTRPMPHIATKGPTLSEVTRGIASFGSEKDPEPPNGD